MSHNDPREQRRRGLRRVRILSAGLAAAAAVGTGVLAADLTSTGSAGQATGTVSDSGNATSSSGQVATSSGVGTSSGSGGVHASSGGS